MVHPGEDALVLIGPEGDFSEEEVRKAAENGFIPISLGNQGCAQRRRHWLPATSSTYRINDTH